MPTSYDGTLLDHLAEHMVYLSMLAATSVVVVAVIVVGTAIVTVVIGPIAVVARAFVLRPPLVLLSRRLVVASCFASVAGIFAAHPSLGCLLCPPCMFVVERQMTTPVIDRLYSVQYKSIFGVPDKVRCDTCAMSC
jgi:hypothetical protein